MMTHFLNTGEDAKEVHRMLESLFLPFLYAYDHGS
jgi:hypothetical protein